MQDFVQTMVIGKSNNCMVYTVIDANLRRFIIKVYNKMYINKTDLEVIRSMHHHPFLMKIENEFEIENKLYLLLDYDVYSAYAYRSGVN